MKNFTFTVPDGTAMVSFYDKPRVPTLSPESGIYVADTNTVKILKQTEGFNKACPLVVIEAGESHKTLHSVEKILSAALKASLGRDSVFIGFGGGVITDMAAFAASIYMRGAQCELVPTTLLAMADAAIGGKTGVDFLNYKNCVGTFYPARKIHIAPSVLSTLSDIEYRSGLAEVLKTGMLYDTELLTLMENHTDTIIARKPEFLLEMVSRSARAKAGVVERDLRESGERMFLNLGHTFAHALESVVGFGTIPHGEAVAWGISRALALGISLGITDPLYAKRIQSILTAYQWPTEAVHPLVRNSTNFSPEQIAQQLVSTMKNDKKKKGGLVRFVLQRNLTDTLVTEVPDLKVLEILQ